MKLQRFWLWLKDESNLKPFSFVISSIGGLVAALATAGWFVYTKLPTVSTPHAVSSVTTQELLPRLRSASLSKCEKPAGLLWLRVERGLPTEAIAASAEAVLKEIVRVSNCFVLVHPTVSRGALQEEFNPQGRGTTAPPNADYVLSVHAALDARTPSKSYVQLLVVEEKTGVQLAASQGHFKAANAQALFGNRLSSTDEPEKYFAIAALDAYAQLVGPIEAFRRARPAP